MVNTKLSLPPPGESWMDKLRTRMLMLARSRLSSLPFQLAALTWELEAPGRLSTALSRDLISLLRPRRSLEELDAALLAAIDRWAMRQPSEPAPLSPDTASAGEAHVRPIPRLRAQEDSVLAALAAAGIDPLRMPPAPQGNKPWPLREEMRKRLGYSPVVIRKTFERLRKQGRMRTG